MRVKGIWIAVLVLLTTAMAHAQTKDELRAFKLYKAASKVMESGRFDQACRMLDDAYNLYPQPNILFRKAVCLEAKDEPEKALELLQGIHKGSIRLQRKVKSEVNRLKILLIKPVRVTVITPDEGADVVVDGSRHCKTPCTLQLPRGTHTFKVTQEGYLPYLLKRRVKGFTGNLLNIPLKKKQKKQVVTSSTRTTPRVSTTGATYWTMNRITGWSMVGVGAILTGVGIYLEVSYFNDKDTLTNLNNTTEGYHYVLESTKQYWGPVLIGAGVVTAASSYFLLRKQPGKKGVQGVSMGVTPDGAFIGSVIDF